MGRESERARALQTRRRTRVRYTLLRDAGQAGCAADTTTAEIGSLRTSAHKNTSGNSRTDAHGAATFVVERSETSSPVKFSCWPNLKCS